MVIFFESKKHPNIYYYQLHGAVGENDAIIVETHFRKFYAHIPNVITITHILDDAILVQKSFLTITAKANEKNKLIISEAHILGLTGIRKFFYMMYRAISPNAPVKVFIAPDLESLNKQLNINIKKDFVQFESNF